LSILRNAAGVYGKGRQIVKFLANSVQEIVDCDHVGVPGFDGGLDFGILSLVARTDVVHV
jgi:hypothetical protein